MRVIKAWWMDKSEEDQLRDIRTRLEQIRTTLTTARSYARLKAAEPGTPTDLRYEALAKALPGPNGEKPAVPVLIEAQEYDQITSAIAMASEFGVRPIILGGRDAPLCAELLKKHDIPVIVDGVHALPRRDDAAYDDNFTLPARLNAAGVRIAIASGEETAHERNLPYVVARACAHGLPHDVAIKSVTIEAAKIMGVADRLGSIEVGKDATLIITTGDPLEVDVHVTGAWIGGVPVDLSNKQSVLAERYREKYRQSKVKNEK
jgi:imidazolonepropionase-like amidohydrolase